MAFIKAAFRGDINIGLYSFATDRYCIMPKIKKKLQLQMEKTLKVRSICSSVLNTGFNGLFISGNSSGIVVSSFIEEDLGSIKKLDKLVIDTNYTALGNLVVMNDNGIILSPLIRSHEREIRKFFGISCRITRIASSSVIGNAALATNKGCVVHMNASPAEIKALEKVLGVPVSPATVNYGTPFTGSGLIANSHGFIVGEATTGHEIGQLNEGLGFL